MSSKIVSTHTHTLNEWDYGYTEYEGGTRIPWMRLNSTHQKKMIYKNKEWITGSIHYPEYKYV